MRFAIRLIKPAQLGSKTHPQGATLGIGTAETDASPEQIQKAADRGLIEIVEISESATDIEPAARRNGPKKRRK